MTTVARAIRKVVAAICNIDDDHMAFATREIEGDWRGEGVAITLTLKGGQKIEIEVRHKRPSTLSTL
ncbi:MAG TPA: hypothetical protein VKY24_24020 [Reyranella sp.]|nr:hypothetical protein [Reyranella sp.]